MQTEIEHVRDRPWEVSLPVLWAKVGRVQRRARLRILSEGDVERYYAMRLYVLDLTQFHGIAIDHIVLWIDGGAVANTYSKTASPAMATLIRFEQGHESIARTYARHVKNGDGVKLSAAIVSLGRKGVIAACHDAGLEAKGGRFQIPEPKKWT